jgi:hypothetical protein
MRAQFQRALFVILLSGLPFLPSGGRADSIEPPLPPLLQNLIAVGRSGDICNPKKGDMLDGVPELNQRLQQLSPAGSSSNVLADTLNKQGFIIELPCKNDKSTYSASFVQHRVKSGFEISSLPTYTAIASIYWKVDQAENIVWEKGFIAYDGL